MISGHTRRASVFVNPSFNPSLKLCLITLSIFKTIKIIRNILAESTKSTDGWTSPITSEGSSEATILGATAESLYPTLEGQNETGMPTHEFNGVKDFPQLGLSDNESHPTVYQKIKNGLIDDICEGVIKDMNTYGLCALDRFMGDEIGLSVLSEVLNVYSAGLFKDGQLVSNRAGANDSRTIRSDQIAWLDGKEEKCPNIGLLISQVDAIIMRANKMQNNGKLGEYTINQRTKVRYGLNINLTKKSKKRN